MDHSSSSSSSNGSPPFVTSSPPDDDIAVASSSSASTSAGRTLTNTAAEPKVRSCAPCRLRRVKCDRTSGDEGMACLKCIKKGIQCTSMPKAGKKTLVRSGPRLELAKAMYGKLGVDKDAEKNLDRVALAMFDPSGVTSKLLSAELEGSLVSSLLEDYLSQISDPLVASTTLISNFENSGRQMAQLDEHSQVLCLAIVAVMARTSDHPLIVGKDAPSSTSLINLAVRDEDLSEYGRRRTDACDTLTKRATKLADVSGCFSQLPTLQSVAALMLLENLVEPHTLDSKSLASRPYLSAYTGHVRLMLENEDPQIASFTPGGVVGHTALIRDALDSLMSGRSPGFSDDHLYLLRGGERGGDRVTPLTLVLMLPRLDDFSASLWFLFDSFLNHLSTTATLAARHLTSIKARKAHRLDLAFCSELLDRLNVAQEATSELIARAQLFDDFGQRTDAIIGQGECVNLPVKGDQYNCFSSDFREQDNRYLWRHIRALRATRCLQIFFVNRVVQTRMEAQRKEESVIFEIAPGSLPDEYVTQLTALSARSHTAAFGAARELVDIFDDALVRGEQIGGSGWMDVQGQEFLFTSLPEWASFLVDTVPEEEGGPLGFDYRVKLASLITIKRALLLVGWSYPRFSEPVRWIQESIDSLERSQSVYWESIAKSLGGGAPFSGSMESWTSAQVDSLLNQLGA